ncbi:hypothetical protein GCM10028806_59270 [Spirosoma terrae]|uniref:TonB C-terminal domain-containing protein n=1 Tax=Spirosoma terrae TaxID=1968276 RepID=A0A6L9LCZ2_9BACT|nr:hypothetical protein [Spirosoma terrae]NDU98396.1 hypothetical protein [Spirosoma terrae]
MKTIIISFLSLLAIVAFVSTSTLAQGRNELVYTTVEKQPEFPGGKAALSRYLAENIQFPSSLMRKNHDTGPVSAKFIVDKEGNVRDVRISTKQLDKKAQKGMADFMTSIIAAIEQMPRWRPGEVKGVPVAVFYTLPIEVNMK